MCTAIRFNSAEGGMFFGRNLDWGQGYGQKVVTTPKGTKYQSRFLGEQEAKFSIIGMAVEAANVPLYFDCGNSAGLAIAGLNFPGYAKYAESPIDGSQNVAAFEFPLWIAMNFGSVAEVRTALKSVAIVAEPFNEQYGVSELHWMIGDAKESIVVEYTKSGMEVFDNPTDVLTNAPGFATHLHELEAAKNQPLPGDSDASARFIRAAHYNQHYPVKNSEEENITRLFRTLLGVATIEGSGFAANGDPEKTIYTSGFSSATGTYYYNTYDDLTVRSAQLETTD